MLGLIRNNMYSVSSTLKWSLVICMIVNVGVLFILFKFSNTGELLAIAMSTQVGQFLGLVGVALEKDTHTKWSKYEKTLPVRVRDIIRARYISFLIYSGIGLLCGTVTVLICLWVSPQMITLERIGYSYTLSIVMILLSVAFTYPMVLKFGPDKSNVLLIFSMFAGLGLYIGIAQLVIPYIGHLSEADMIYRVGSILVSAIIFMLSYFLSIHIYKQKQF